MEFKTFLTEKNLIKENVFMRPEMNHMFGSVYVDKDLLGPWQSQFAPLTEVGAFLALQ